jgi:hypothetical protein
MSVNPFDIKTLIMAKHAQHVVLIHFPIALFTAPVAFDVRPEVVTYVAGAFCNPYVRVGPRNQWRARRDSNPRPLAPEANALSI